MVTKSYVLFLITCILLSSCMRSTSLRDLSFENSRYYSKGGLFTGLAASYHSSGEREGEHIFSNGILKRSTSFGYQGEIIGVSEYDELPTSTIDGLRPIRIVKVQSVEGDYSYTGILVVVENETGNLNCDSTITEIRNHLDKRGYSYTCETPCRISIATGELEDKLCSSSY